MIWLIGLGIFGVLCFLVPVFERFRSTRTNDLSMTASDPQIYLSVEQDAKNTLRTNFILHNQGETTAHDVAIQPLKMSSRSVTFRSIGVIAAGDKESVSPVIEYSGAPFVNGIFQWLEDAYKENKITRAEWPISIQVRYRDSLNQKRFRATMTLVFHAIRYMLEKEHNLSGGLPILEFRDVDFKRIS